MTANTIMTVQCEFCSAAATTEVWQEALGAGTYFSPCCATCKDSSLDIAGREADVRR